MQLSVPSNSIDSLIQNDNKFENDFFDVYFWS